MALAHEALSYRLKAGMCRADDTRWRHEKLAAERSLIARALER